MILISGLAWTITYLALIYRGFRDRTFGMPLVALALNLAWEFVFTFVHPPDETHILIVNGVWLLFDLIYCAAIHHQLRRDGHNPYRRIQARADTAPTSRPRSAGSAGSGVFFSG